MYYILNLQLFFKYLCHLGLYLEGMEPFKFDMLETYKQAGYRGEIGRGFLTKGGLVHVFRRGEFINSSEFGARYIICKWCKKCSSLSSN